METASVLDSRPHKSSRQISLGINTK